MKYTITGDIARQAIHKAVDSAQIGDVVSIGQPTRSSEQNAMLHPLLTDIANQKEWMGKKRTMLQWKVIMVSAHSITTGEPAEMVIGLEGEVVNLRESTAAMSKKRFSSLMEYVLAWGAMNEVRFIDKTIGEM
jgi:hypothetical protein